MATGIDPKFSRHVRDVTGNSLEKLIEAGDSVSDLLAHPGWQVVQQMLKAEQDQVDNNLDTDRPLEQAEYAALHGRRAGLRAAAKAAEAVVIKAAEALDEQRRKHEGAAEPALSEA
jgi:hypothetical protein